MDFIAGDLPSWIAVAIAIGVALVAWRLAQSASYVEFHPNWNVQLDDDTGDIEVNGKVTIVSNAAFLAGTGKLTLGKRWKRSKGIPLVFVGAEPHLLRTHEATVTLKGHYNGGPITEETPGRLELRLRLSDGKTRKTKMSLALIPKQDSDKES